MIFNILIDGIPLEFPLPGRVSIIEACRVSGVLVPRFCYHEMLSIAGNCRMCLIEIDGVEKPVASCATEAKNEMVIFTENTFVKKARENVLETILINHPLDCPICDQAGECDLQDQARYFGMTKSRYFYQKKTSADKICNAVVKTVMTRCITCTRCVRFASEIAGIDYFGTLGRGRETEIGSYVSKIFQSEISGNVVDLCPVGALNNKPYSFKARPWELSSLNSIDLNDTLQAHIYVHYKGNSLYRILPKKHRYSHLITDTARYMYEHVNHKRINKAHYIINKINEQNESFDVHYVKEDFYNNIYTFFTFLKAEFQGKKNIKRFQKTKKFQKINFIIDNKCDLITASILSEISRKNFVSNIKIKNVNNLNFNDNLYSTNKFSLENVIIETNNLCLTLGSYIRHESALLNTNLRYKYNITDLNLVTFGYSSNSNIPNKLLTLSLENTFDIFEGYLTEIAKNLIRLKHTLFLVGEMFIKRISSISSFIHFLNKYLILANLLILRNDVNAECMNMFNQEISSLDNKISNEFAIKKYGEESFNWNNHDEVNFFINTEDNIFTRKLFYVIGKGRNIFFASNWSTIAKKANVVIPINTIFESTGLKEKSIYLTMNHVPQIAENALYYKGLEKNSAIFFLRELFKKSCTILPKNKSSDIINMLPYYSYLFNLTDQYSFDELSKLDQFYGLKFLSKNNNKILISKYPMKQELKNFYENTYFSKHSRTLIRSSMNYKLNYTNFISYN